MNGDGLLLNDDKVNMPRYYWLACISYSWKQILLCATAIPEFQEGRGQEASCSDSGIDNALLWTPYQQNAFCVNIDMAPFKANKSQARGVDCWALGSHSWLLDVVEPFCSGTKSRGGIPAELRIKSTGIKREVTLKAVVILNTKGIKTSWPLGIKLCHLDKYLVWAAK